MSEGIEYESVGKMTFVPKGYRDRTHGWFYRIAGVGRLTEPPEPFDIHVRSLPAFYGYHIFDKAHLVMLTEEGIIPKEDGVACLRALREMEREGIDKTRRAAGGVSHSGEAYLIQKRGLEIGGRIHAGRSSHDLARVQQRVVQRDSLLDVMDWAMKLRETLMELADKHVETIMPFWTAMQHGRPITFAFYLMTFVKMLERHHERLELCYKHTNVSPAGISEGTGTDFPLNPHRTMELLGFDDIYRNANDMWLSTDFRTEAISALAMLNDVTSRLGEDLQTWCSYEYGIAELADRYCGTSSVMSQKKNPGAGILSTVGRAVKHLMFLGSDEVFDRAVSDTINCLNMAIGLLKTTTWNTERMKELCTVGWICNADLARTIVQERGLPWRTAHQITATLVRLAISEGKTEADVTPELLDRAAKEYPGYGKPLNLSQEAIKKAYDPVRSVMSRAVHGGTAPERVREQIAESRKRLRQDRASVEAKRDKLKAAADKLEKAIDALIGG